MVTKRTRDRGQILLVGALALAFVVLSLTAVYTAQLSGRPASAGTAGVDAGNAEEFNREARRNARVIAVRKNHESLHLSPSAANASVVAGTRNYSQLVGETYAGRSGTVTEVTYVGTETGGTRTVSRNASFENPDAPTPTDWSPVEDRSRVGWVVFNFNLTAMNETTDPFEMVVESNNGTETTYTFARNETGNSVIDIDVASNATNTTRSVTCNPLGSRSVVNVRRGVTFTGGCEFGPSLGEVEGPHIIKFRNADEAVGAFSVVTNRSAPSSSLSDCTAADVAADSFEPCDTHVVWNATVRTGYYTDRLSYTNEQNVTVYEGV